MFLDISRFSITLNHIDKFSYVSRWIFFLQISYCVFYRFFFLSGVTLLITSVICRTSQYELPQYFFSDVWWFIVAIFCGMSRHVYCLVYVEHLTIYTEFSIFFGHLTNTIDNLWVFNREYSRRCFRRLKAHYLDILSSVYMNFPDISSFVSR